MTMDIVQSNNNDNMSFSLVKDDKILSPSVASLGFQIQIQK